ncbi:hypothetical protein SFRURICE_012072 [Spodoptera frugiperda]|nr:hypothetical protein SFRURICE_012072 [Spodoptera frugiperda]
MVPSSKSSFRPFRVIQCHYPLFKILTFQLDVCSETDLSNAEVFKGVIFCYDCAQRIFQGCSTARKTKTTHGGRGRRTTSKSKRRDRIKAQERRLDGSRDGVIELARLAGSITTLSDDVEEKKSKKTSQAAMTMDPLYGERKVHEEKWEPLQMSPKSC